MKFDTPRAIDSFEIPDEWWSFAEMPYWRATSTLYPYSVSSQSVQRVLLTDIEPPKRSADIPLFKKFKLVPVLMAFQSPECSLPPVEVESLTNEPYYYRVVNGLHRYYASVAAGYTYLPVVVTTPFRHEGDGPE